MSFGNCIPYYSILFTASIMRRFINLLFCVLVLGTSSGIAQEKTYSCRYFSIEYPSDWTTVVVGNLNSATASLTDASLTIKPINIGIGQPTYNVEIHMDPSINWSDINQSSLGMFKDLIRSQFSSVSFITEPTFVTFKSLPGIMMEYSAYLNGFKARFTQYIVHKRSGLTYFLTSCVEYNKSSTQLPKVKEILNSIEF